MKRRGGGLFCACHRLPRSDGGLAGHGGGRHLAGAAEEERERRPPHAAVPGLPPSRLSLSGLGKAGRPQALAGCRLSLPDAHAGSAATLRALPGPRRGAARHASAGPQHVQRPEAALLVHLADGHGHPERAGEDAAAERDLQVHHGPLPLLPGEHAALAELAAPQPLLQRLLHQDPAPARPAGQGLLLGAAPQLRGHVRERQLPAPPQALQGAQGRPAGALQGARLRRRRRRRGRPLPPAAGQAAPLRPGRRRRRPPPAAPHAARLQPGRRLAAPAARLRLQAPLRHREHHRPRVQDARRRRRRRRPRDRRGAGRLLPRARRLPAARPAGRRLAPHVRLRHARPGRPHRRHGGRRRRRRSRRPGLRRLRGAPEAALPRRRADSAGHPRPHQAHPGRRRARLARPAGPPARPPLELAALAQPHRLADRRQPKQPRHPQRDAHQPRRRPPRRRGRPLTPLARPDDHRPPPRPRPPLLLLSAPGSRALPPSPAEGHRRIARSRLPDWRGAATDPGPLQPPSLPTQDGSPPPTRRLHSCGSAPVLDGAPVLRASLGLGKRRRPGWVSLLLLLLPPPPPFFLGLKGWESTAEEEEGPARPPGSPRGGRRAASTLSFRGQTEGCSPPPPEEAFTRE